MYVKHVLQLELGYREAFTVKLQPLDMLHIASVHMAFPEWRGTLPTEVRIKHPLASAFSPWHSSSYTFLSFYICNRGFLNTLLRKYSHKLIPFY